MTTTSATLTPRTRNVPTWKMTRDELARVWAAHHGIEGRAGGWLYLNGAATVQGYTSLALYLERNGVIAEGSGIDWRKSDRLGGANLARRARAALYAR